MSVKETVLRLLEAKKGDMVSGQWLAEESGASRTAVWKAIHSLIEEGYPVDASPNRGYCLSPSSDFLSADGIHGSCHRLAKNSIFVYKELDSTNNVAKKLIGEKREMPFLVVAESQTGGRGRMGRSFYSPPGSGIYMTLALRPELDVSRSVLMTTAASVAVCRGIRDLLGLECSIKWVNDIYLKGKKVCGILTEGITNFETGLVDALVIGIGINYRMPEGSFPEELQEIAGTLLKEDSPSGLSPVRNKLVGSIADHLISLIDDLDSREFMKEYRQRSQVLGKEIRFIDGTQRGGRSQEGTVVDIDDNGGLVIRTRTGEQLTLNSGEITVRTI